MKNPILSRLAAFFLAVCLLASYAVPVRAAGVHWQEVDINAPAPDLTDRQVEEIPSETGYQATDIVRVSIVLAEKSTVQAGYATMGIARNQEAMAYQDSLRTAQETMAQTISAQVLGGRALDVVWNLTLVGNIISANVPYGKLEEIRQLPGVEDAFVEQWYAPQTTEEADVVSPQTYISSGMTGAGLAWEQGYTGAGSRVAIIDTGTDTDHQSFDNGAFLYALKENAEEAGLSQEAYLASLNLLDVEELAAVLPQLNVHERSPQLTAEDLYLNEKLPFGYNYVDTNLRITHDYDNFGGHGSHVAGISAANRYIPEADGYLRAADTVFVSGAAPDAQIITLKVAGVGGGIAESDYMAAIEDAILLDCDAVNLSLGSNMPGEVYNNTSVYAELLDYLSTTDTVVAVSAGNSNHWAVKSATGGYLYNDDISFATGGSPGTYTNTLTVASVDSAGAIGPHLLVNDQALIYYESTDFGNQAMSNLDQTQDGSGTEYPFVYVNGFGAETDFDGIDLNGKVVFCSRGGGLNFAQKANNAVAKGAAAVVVYNNAAGVFGMNLTGYMYAAPCVSLTRSQADAVKAAASEAKTADGQTYYTGSLKICARNAVGLYGGSYNMSDFSSWGVPGDLSLKPELTAPGGSILSVNGEVKDTDQYFLMSGTSMAAPQVTGLTALLMQYFRETGLAEKAGVSPRVLAHSLLMSTAQPLYEEASGGYYSLLKQGAGLAKVDDALAAQAYVLVDGQPDGKVKAELGDDPDRTGSYSFSFTLHNLTDSPLSYVLRTDLFTQDVFEDNGYRYLDTQTRALAVDAGFTSGGNPVLSGDDVLVYDLNGDGKTNQQDADFLLEYLLGNETKLNADGDINGDGKVNTYDAHVLLALLEDQACITVPAGGSVPVEVTLTLPDQVKAYLDEATPNGAYIEAFVYAEAVQGEEIHSIPVLGFYGSWTDASMYDVDTALERSYGISTRAPYLGINDTNLMTISYDGISGEYLFGGNPLAEEETYLPQRNAFNNLSGDTLKSLYFTQIRTAGSSLLQIRNPETGEIYVADELGLVSPAYYFPNQGVWVNQRWGVDVAWTGTDSRGKPLPDGTPVEISLITAPEYYRNQDGTYNWEALGHGAYLSTQFTIDSTDPVMKDVDASQIERNRLRITASDNQYVAAVALLNSSGIRILSSVVPNQAEPGKDVTVELPLDGVSGKKFLVAVYDYARNATTYEVTLDLPGSEARPYFTAFNRTTQYGNAYYNWVGFNQSGAETRLGDMADNNIKAAAFAGGYVFAVDSENRFMVAEDEDLCNFTAVATLDAQEAPIKDFRDLAYNEQDGKLYGLYYSDANRQRVPYLCTVDMLTGVMTVLGELGEDMYNLAIDGQGAFYGVGYGNGILYSFTADTFAQPTTLGDMGAYTSRALNSLAWDHNEDTLYWAYCSEGQTQLLKIDIQNATASLVRTLPFAVVGLYILPEQYDDQLFRGTDTVYNVSVSQTEARLLSGETLRLSAKVLPWTVTDDSVVWSSSDEALATVDPNGKVTAKSAGTVTITAAAKLDPTKTAACTLEVVEVSEALNGLVWDGDGDIWWGAFHANDLPNYTKLTSNPCQQDFAAVAYGADGCLYGATMDLTNQLSDYYRIDPDTFEATLIGGSDEIFYADLAYAPNLDCMLAVYGPYVLMIDEETGAYSGYWEWHNSANLIGIAYGGSQYNEEYDAYIDTFFLLDQEGNVFLEGFATIDGQYSYFNGKQNALLKNLNISTDAPYFSSLYYDGQYLFWSKYSESQSCTELIAWDCEGTDDVYRLGTFGTEVWPVCGLFQLEGAENVSQNLVDLSQSQATATAAVGTMELQQENRISGGLQSAVLTESQAHPEILPNSTGSYDEAKGTVTVAVTAGQVSTNGRATISYDSAKLVLADIASPLEVSASREADGAVELAYAAANALPDNETLALLTFQVKTGATGDTEIRIHCTERGDQTVDTTESIAVALAHKCPSQAFADLDTTQWYHEYTDYVIGNNLMNGMGNHRFVPNGTTTRAMLVTTLYRLAASPEVGEGSTFTDVAEGAWYADAIAWAQDVGIAKGITETRFAPNSNVTREQAATFLYRFVTEYLEVESAESADLSMYKDADKISSYAKTAVAWATAKNLFEGFPNGTLQPKDTLTRAQLAKLLTILDQNF